MASSTTSSRPYNGKYTIEELRRNGFIESLQLRQITGDGNDLSEDPHPIFTDWHHSPNHKYEFLAPILKLASAFWGSAASTSFIHAIMYGPRIQRGSETVELQASGPSDDLMRQQVAAGLGKLQGHIRWMLYGPKDVLNVSHRAHLADARGFCVRNEQDAVLFHGPLPMFSKLGTGSRIFLNYTFVQKLINLLAVPDPTPDVRNHVLQIQFIIAVTMCHELCHALHNATTADQWEPFYSTQQVSELGHAWENEVFGGHVAPHEEIDAAVNLVVIGEWPCEIDASDEVIPSAVRAPLPDVVEYCYVPMEWIFNVQRQQRWDMIRREGLENDREILYPPRQIGYEMHNKKGSEKGYTVPVLNVDLDES